jgi:hypothetical protein
MKKKKGFVKRQFPRINVDIAAEIRLSDGPGEFLKARIINISRDGLFILVPVSIWESTKFSVRFRIPDDTETVELKARVLYIIENETVEGFSRGAGVRLCLDDLAGSQKSKLKEYFDSLYVYGWFS